MSLRTTSPIAARWVWGAVLGSAVLAILSHVLGGSSTERITGVLTIATLLGIVYLLYRWGQVRERVSPPEDTDSEEHRRQQEMKAEAGGFGGNGGGL